MATSFDLFDTLVSVSYPADAATRLAEELRARDVAVPDDWATAYAETHIHAPEGAEVPHPAHVSAALASRGVSAPGNAPRSAVVAAFDPEVRVREGAHAAVAAAADAGPVGLLTDCAVPELVARTLIRADLRGAFDAVTTSVACGWRTSHPGAFETHAEALGVSPDALVYVTTSDECALDSLGGTVLDIPLTDLPAWLEARR